MTSKEPDLVEMNFNVINSLCDQLDFLASPNIEEELGCSLDCCIGNSGCIKTLIICAEKSAQMRFIIGDEGLKLVRQLDEMSHHAFCYYDDGKGFSKKQRWLDLVDYINKANVLLKDAVKGYKEAINDPFS